MALKYDCVACRKQVTATKNGRYRSHSDGNGDPCEMSSDTIPEHILAQPVGEDDRPEVPREGIDFAKCPSCDRNVSLTKLGYFEDHKQTLMGGDRCPNGGVRAKHAKKIEDVQLPAVDSEPAASTPRVEAAAPVPVAASTEEPAKSNLERTPMAMPSELLAGFERAGVIETSSPESTTTLPEPAPETLSPSGWAERRGVSTSGHFEQPSSPYLQPPEYVGPEKPEPMTGLAQDLATMIKETFYSYSNRRSSDNRSAQTTLGPSEVGTPCDRRLAMALMGIPAVNAGGDGWAAFAGTCIHAGMAEIYTFADAGTGRYAVEFPVTTPSPWVPRGTSDLFDRRIYTIIDWKMMGKYSLDKFKLNGPSETYEVQGQVYGLGAELAGEKVKNVAIVGLPRAGSSLDEMHVHVMPYDRKRALAGLARVDDIATKVGTLNLGAGNPPIARLGLNFDAADDCRYCPFFRKNDEEMTKGCPGI